MTARFRRQLEELEARPTPRPTELEQIARLRAELGRPDDARSTFLQAAQSKLDRKPPDFTPAGFHLGVGNLWRLGGDVERAATHLELSRSELGAEARLTDQRKPPFIFTLLLLGHHDELLAVADEFGEEACGERAWAVAETVRADVSDDDAELERRLAEWADRAHAEDVATSGLHPSNRDIRDVLVALSSENKPQIATPTSQRPSPKFHPVVDDGVNGEAIGWWGNFVVLADGVEVMLYDAEAQRLAYRVTAAPVDGAMWDPGAACFTHGRNGFAVTTVASGIAATVVRCDGTCSFSADGRLLTIETGFAATVARFDGVELIAGAAPVAVRADGTAVAMMSADASLRVSMLDAAAPSTAAIAIEQSCSAIAWFPSGDRLACAEDAGQTVRVVSLSNGELLDEAVLHEDDPIVAVAVAPSGTMYASVGFDGVVGVRDLAHRRSASHQFEERLEDVQWDSTGELIGVLGELGWFVITPDGERLDAEPASSLVWHPTRRLCAVTLNRRLVVFSY